MVEILKILQALLKTYVHYDSASLQRQQNEWV